MLVVGLRHVRWRGKQTRRMPLVVGQLWCCKTNMFSVQLSEVSSVDFAENTDCSVAYVCVEKERDERVCVREGETTVRAYLTHVKFIK